MENDNIFENVIGMFDQEEFHTLNEEMSLKEYIEASYKNPKLNRNSWQTVYDMIMSKGYEEFEKFRETHRRYKFFEECETPIEGLEKPLNQLVQAFKGAACHHGTQNRVILLHGPVGSAKSTICRSIKRGLEKYSRTPEGAWYSYKWVNLPPEVYNVEEEICCMHENPLKLLDENTMRAKILDDLNKILIDQTLEQDRITQYTLKMEGDLNPRCKKFKKDLIKYYNGDFQKVIDNHIVVVRMVHSESDRVGIATFQPKDEKNQDATELTGDINYRNISEFGSDSDPRAFNFDGEFCRANRGIFEFIEVLKLHQEFLYELLEATQGHRVKPKKFAQIPIDEVILSHTNTPEFVKMQNNQFMEALRDRTYKIDIPYLLEWSKEINVLNNDYGPDNVRLHIAPHTLEVAAFWAILTRVHTSEDETIDPRDKVKLYDGKPIPGHTQDSVKELKDKYRNEGMQSGVSVRYVQDKISDCLSKGHEYINPFMVLNALQRGLRNSSLFNKEEEITRYEMCIDLAKKELDDILKNEVQKALVADEDAIVRLCTNYIDNVMAYIHKKKIVNKYTGEEGVPDERLMSSIEEMIGVTGQLCDEFRRSIASFIADLSLRGERFNWASNERLRKALEARLYEDTKDHIKLSSLSSGSAVVDPDIQEKIDMIKTRLIKHYGYNDDSAKDVLDYVASIFARGDVAEEE